MVAKYALGEIEFLESTHPCSCVRANIDIRNKDSCHRMCMCYREFVPCCIVIDVEAFKPSMPVRKVQIGVVGHKFM